MPCNASFSMNIHCYGCTLYAILNHQQTRKAVGKMLKLPSPPHAQQGRETFSAEKAWRNVWMWCRALFVCALSTFLFCFLIMQPMRVQGESMRDTLQNGDLMWVTKYDYILGAPERFDVVICNFPQEGETNFVKRIVGVAGDTVAIQDGSLYINQVRVEEPYIDFPPNYEMPPTEIAQGHYFVLGDNRTSSKDSHIVGQLTRSQIRGHVQYVFWPFDQARKIT